MKKTDPRFYILDKDKNVIGTNDVNKWGEFFESAGRILAQDEIGDHLVSTVFIGIDHNFSDSGPPIVFETMVFKRDKSNLGSLGKDVYQSRCATWAEAVAMHKEAVALVKAGKIPRGPTLDPLFPLSLLPREARSREEGRERPRPPSTKPRRPR